jgi:hypothetical protein
MGDFSVSSPITDQTLNGVTLEPEGPSSTIKDSNKSIMPRTYNVVPHVSPNHRLPISYELMNVPGRDHILLHNGDFRKDTEGCILMGTRAS